MADPARIPGRRTSCGRISDARKQRFLTALEETASVTAACARIVVSTRAMYEIRKRDPEFRKAWAAAIELGIDALEDEAVRRAREGVDEPVFHRGSKCGNIRRYSDTLLMFILKAARPEKYKDRAANEISGGLSVNVVSFADAVESGGIVDAAAQLPAPAVSATDPEGA